MPCASSSTEKQPYSSATSRISGNRATCPSIEYTPSITNILGAEGDTVAATSRRSRGLLWENRSTLAIDNRMPSQRQEWIFLSARMTSPFWANDATLAKQER